MLKIDRARHDVKDALVKIARNYAAALASAMDSDFVQNHNGRIRYFIDTNALRTCLDVDNPERVASLDPLHLDKLYEGIADAKQYLKYRYLPLRELVLGGGLAGQAPLPLVVSDRHLQEFSGYYNSVVNGYKANRSLGAAKILIQYKRFHEQLTPDTFRSEEELEQDLLKICGNETCDKFKRNLDRVDAYLEALEKAQRSKARSGLEVDLATLRRILCLNAYGQLRDPKQPTVYSLITEHHRLHQDACRLYFELNPLDLDLIHSRGRVCLPTRDLLEYHAVFNYSDLQATRKRNSGDSRRRYVPQFDNFENDLVGLYKEVYSLFDKMAPVVYKPFKHMPDLYNVYPADHNELNDNVDNFTVVRGKSNQPVETLKENIRSLKMGWLQWSRASFETHVEWIHELTRTEAKEIARMQAGSEDQLQAYSDMNRSQFELLALSFFMTTETDPGARPAKTQDFGKMPFVGSTWRIGEHTPDIELQSLINELRNDGRRNEWPRIIKERCSLWSNGQSLEVMIAIRAMRSGKTGFVVAKRILDDLEGAPANQRPSGLSRSELAYLYAISLRSRRRAVSIKDDDFDKAARLLNHTRADDSFSTRRNDGEKLLLNVMSSTWPRIVQLRCKPANATVQLPVEQLDRQLDNFCKYYDQSEQFGLPNASEGATRLQSEYVAQTKFGLLLVAVLVSIAGKSLKGKQRTRVNKIVGLITEVPVTLNLQHVVDVAAVTLFGPDPGAKFGSRLLDWYTRCDKHYRLEPEAKLHEMQEYPDKVFAIALLFGLMPGGVCIAAASPT